MWSPMKKLVLTTALFLCSVSPLLGATDPAAQQLLVTAKLQASNGNTLGTFKVGGSPFGVTFDGKNVWVSNGASNTVTKLRASDGAREQPNCTNVHLEGVVPLIFGNLLCVPNMQDPGVVEQKVQSAKVAHGLVYQSTYFARFGNVSVPYSSPALPCSISNKSAHATLARRRRSRSTSRT